MNRKRVFWYVLESVFVAVFAVFFFTLSGSVNTASVWIAFTSILVAYAALLLTPLMVRKGPAQADYRRPLFVASVVYFNLTFIAGLVFIILRPERYTLSLLVNVGLFGAYAIFLLINLLANEYTADQEEKREEELKYVKVVPARLKALLGTVKDNALRKKIEEAYDLISTSPAKSSGSVKSFEESILEEVADLEAMDASSEAVKMMQSVELIISLAQKRNTKLNLENKNN